MRESFELSKDLLKLRIIHAQTLKLIEPGIEVPVQAEQVLPRWAVWNGKEAVHEALSGACSSVVIASLSSIFNGSLMQAFRIFGLRKWPHPIWAAVT